MINKDPIYQQLNKALRALLGSDKYAVGDQFLTERMVCERYDVSRATANKALSNLVAEGVLRFRKGVGTFVEKKPLGGQFLSMTSFTENARRAGLEPSTEVLRFDKLTASEETNAIAGKQLKVRPGDRLYRIERLRKANGVPMILEDRYVVGRYCPDLLQHSLNGSLYALFEQVYGLNVTRTEETIQAVILNDYQAGLLGVNSGAAGLVVSAVGYVDNDQPLWWETTVHKPDAFEFRCQVNPGQHYQTLEGRVVLENPD
jgi:GntR family transcriptional regulator